MEVIDVTRKRDASEAAAPNFSLILRIYDGYITGGDMVTSGLRRLEDREIEAAQALMAEFCAEKMMREDGETAP